MSPTSGLGCLSSCVIGRGSTAILVEPWDPKPGDGTLRLLGTGDRPRVSNVALRAQRCPLSIIRSNAMAVAWRKQGNTSHGLSGPLKTIAVALLMIGVHPCIGQEVRLPRTSVSAAFGLLFYQSGFGMENTTGIELAIGRSVREQLRAEAGLRLGVDPVLPDIFLRLMATQQIGRWKPSVGIENGWSDRAFFEGDSELLKETRDAMSDELGHWYISSHIEPLCFGFKDQWDISMAELDIGTHYERIGSTVRLNVNFLRVRRTF